MSWLSLPWVLLAITPAPIPAQAPDGRKTFEVASIRPDDNAASGSMSIDIHKGGRFTATNASIKMLIRNAFDLQSFQLEGGPAWLDSVKYDVTAKTADSREITRDDLKPLLQSLLADRFGLRYHRETRELTAYSLTVARVIPKLTASLASAEDADAVGPSIRGSNNGGNAQIKATRVSMADLVRELSGQLQTVVSNETNIVGVFDFTLAWSFNPVPESPYPSIFTALQDQLGLRLEARKGPVGIVVIDHVERVPTGN